MRTAGFTALVLSLALAGAARAAEAPSGLPLSADNLGGETCRVASAPTLAAVVPVHCGTVEAGTLRAAARPALPQDPAARLTALTTAALALRSQDGAAANCGTSVWLGPAGGIALSLCHLAGNGWPHIVLAAASSDTLYVGEGEAEMLPVLVQALAALTGQDAAAARAAGVAFLSAHVPAKVLHARTADTENYKAAVETGRLAGGAQDYAGAERAYRHALDIETRLFGADSAPVGQTLAELALQVSNQGRFDEADALFRRAEPIIQAANNSSLRARLASYLALNAANQRHFADALKLARQATAERRAAVAAAGGNEAAPLAEGELSHSLRLEAEMALRLGDLTAARAAGEEALWIVFQQPGLPLWWRPDMLALMGDINAASGRVLAAERNLKDAAELDAKLFGETARTAAARIHLGAFYSGQQLYPASLDAYRKAFAILRANKTARAHLVADQLLPYFTAAAAQTGRSAAFDAEIFTAAQFVGGGVSDQTIARMAARQAAATPALAGTLRDLQAAQRARDTARIDLAAENSKADEDRSAARVTRLRGELDAATTRAEALATKLASAYPAYAKLAAPGPAALAQVQAALAPDAAFLDFVIGVNGGYALLVKPEGLVLRRLDLTRANVVDDVAILRKAVTPTLGRVAPFSLKTAYSLYKKLLGPLEAELSGVQMLVVAPTPELANLPLSLLVTAPPPASGADSKAAWLIRRMAIAQVPSARAFLSLRAAQAARRAPPKPILALAAPGFSGSKKAGASALSSLAGACLDGGPIAPGLLRALPPLPNTAGEAEAVARSLGAGRDAVLLGSQASEADLRSRNLAQYGVLYFATHGLLPGELHCQSEPALALAPPARAGSTDSDGLLTASEVAGLDLNADLVVLSACNTAAGGGGRYGGGALEGLADAFFEAGARAVLASHWQVPSLQTAHLMTNLFARYGADRQAGLAQALRQAQLALIDKPASAHPFNWAAFTLIGDGDAAAPQPNKQARAQP